MQSKPDKTIWMEWFSRGDHDFQSAKLLLQEGGHTDTVVFLLHQTVEKYLKGFLLAKGWPREEMKALVKQTEKLIIKIKEDR